MKMTNVKVRRLNIAEMHRRTSALAKEAGASGDAFLQYLYALALSHLEEKAGIRREIAGKTASSHDPAIVALANKLRRDASKA